LELLRCSGGEEGMKITASEWIFGIIASNPVWNYWEKVNDGIVNGTVSFKTPFGDLLLFLFMDKVWIILLCYALIRLITFIKKKIQQNAELKEKEDNEKIDKAVAKAVKAIKDTKNEDIEG
jgi:hypothetical protein